MFFSKVSAAGFVTLERVNAHELGKLQEISNPSGALERLIEIFVIARNADVPPKFLAQLWNFGDRFAQPRRVPSHPAFIPKKQSELFMERVERAVAIYSKNC